MGGVNYAILTHNLIKKDVFMQIQEIKKCRHSKELKLFGFGAVVTVLLLIALFVGAFYRTEIIGEIKSDIIKDYKTEHIEAKNLSNKEILTKLPEEDKELLEKLDYYYWYVILLLPLAFFFLVLYAIGKMYGDLVGNSVRLDEHQYPKVYKIFEEMAKELGFEKVPELYLVNGSGALNAYATCVPGFRNFAAIYSDIFERCLKNDDMKSLRFILGHELGHIKFNHVKWWYNFLTVWMNFPVANYLFGLPLSRSREYGCDKLGEKLSNDSTGRPLMMLSAGKYAYQDIDLEEYVKEHFDKPSFWAWTANLSQDHGLSSWRIAAIRKNHEAGLIFKNTK